MKFISSILHIRTLKLAELIMTIHVNNKDHTIKDGGLEFKDPIVQQPNTLRIWSKKHQVHKKLK
jgi:hypothetical protein